MRRPDVLVILGYIWRHVSAVNRPSSGQNRIVLLRYSQKLFVQWDPIVYIKTGNNTKFLVMVKIFNNIIKILNSKFCMRGLTGLIMIKIFNNIIKIL